MSRKLAVFFPGRKYGVDCPLLYYSDFICKSRGYETLYMHYAAHREEKSDTTIYEDIQNAREYVMDRLQKIPLKDYDEILFVSKSIGTVLASIAQTELKIKVRNLYFTPLEPTLPYLSEKRLNEPAANLIFAGTKDSFLDAETLRKICMEEKLWLRQFEGLGHSMEAENISETLDIMKEIMELAEEFIAG